MARFARRTTNMVANRVSAAPNGASRLRPLWYKVKRSPVENTPTPEPDPNPEFTSQPQSQALYQENKLLSISGASVSPATGYQWQKLNGSLWQDVQGQTSLNLSLANAQNAEGTYRLSVVNGTSERVYSIAVEVVSVYLQLRADLSGDPAIVATTDKSTYRWAAPAGQRYVSAYYFRRSNDTAFNPSGRSTSRSVATWTTDNQTAVPVTASNVRANGQWAPVVRAGSANVTASVGNLISTLAITVN